MRLALAGSVLAICILFLPAVQGDCKCHQPDNHDKARWGGNQVVILVPEKHFRDARGIVEILDKQPVRDALVEVFDKPDYLVSSKRWNEHPQQHRLRAGVTSPDGNFCFKDLPSGTYELRVNRDRGRMSRMSMS